MTSTSTRTRTRYHVWAPTYAGARQSEQHVYRRLYEARAYAAHALGHRRDLTWQDVWIERDDGSIVEYAGPER